MYIFIERHGNSKVFRRGYCLLAVLLVSIVIVHCYSLSHFTFNGERLVLSKIGKDFVVMTDRSGNDAELRGPYELHLTGESNMLMYQNRETICTVDWEETGGYIYHFSDGSSLTEPMLIISFDDIDSPIDRMSDIQRGEYELINRMRSYLQNGSPVWNAVWSGLLALVILLLGVGIFCYPDAVWKLNTMFTVRGGEPTEWALFINQLSGIVSIIMAFIIPFLLN